MKADLSMKLYQTLHPFLLFVFKVFVLSLKIAARISPSVRQKTRKLIQTLEIRTDESGSKSAFEVIDMKSLGGEQPIWIHAASGEFEYAKPVIREIRKLNPSVKILVTYFSPTYAENVRKFPGVTFAVPLPLDSSAEILKFLDHFHPKCLLIARTDAWPNTVFETVQKNIPTLLFSTTFHDQSKRVSFFAKALTRSTLKHLKHIQCVSPSDQTALRNLGLTSVEIAGDTRYDQVIERLSGPRPPQVLAQMEAIKSVIHQRSFIAGSIWPEDLKPVLSAFSTTLKRDSNPVTLILVPHEISEVFLGKIEGEISSALPLGMTAERITRLSRISNARAPVEVLIVDTVGLLAELYLLSDVAFVGGSFRGSVHSVMEPLAAGCLTLVGPYHLNNREAIEFQNVDVANSGVKITAVTSVNDEAEFKKRLSLVFESIADKSVREATSSAIISAVRARGGATEKVIQWLRNEKLV